MSGLRQGMEGRLLSSFFRQPSYIHLNESHLRDFSGDLPRRCLIDSARGTMTTPAQRRLMQDFRSIQEDPSEGFSCAPAEDNILLWHAVIFGPKDTPFADGTFKLSIEFTEEYPDKPPKAKFVSKMFHPNVHLNGLVCLDFLKSRWMSGGNVASVLMSIYWLLGEPNTQSPANPLAAKYYISDRARYIERVQKVVEKSWEDFSSDGEETETKSDEVMAAELAAEYQEEMEALDAAREIFPPRQFLRQDLRRARKCEEMGPYRSKKPADVASDFAVELQNPPPNRRDVRYKLEAARKFFEYLSALVDHQPEVAFDIYNKMKQGAYTNAFKQNATEDDLRNLIIILAIQVEPPEGAGVASTSQQRTKWTSLKRIFQKATDPYTLKLAARTTSYLIHTSKSESKDIADPVLVEFGKFMDPTLEGLFLAGVILARELALTIPSSFMSNASIFYSKVFPLIKDPKQEIREAAAQALTAAFLVTAQRESKEDNKEEWFKTALNEAVNRNNSLPKDDSIHASLLIFNELLRVANERAEKARLEILDINPTTKQLTGNPVDWLIESNWQPYVESSNAREIVEQNFSTIVQKCMDSNVTKASFCHLVLMEIFPRLSSFAKPVQNEEDEKQRKRNINQMAQYAMNHISTNTKPGPLNSHALISLGLIIYGSPNELEHKAIDAVKMIKQQIQYAQNKKRPIDPSVFQCLALICHSQKTTIERLIKELLELLFNTGLSKGLTRVMHEVCAGMPSLKPDVQDGILKQLSVLLMDTPVPDKLAAPTDPPKPSRPLIVKDIPLTKLGLKTLGEFDFQRHSLQMFMNFIAQGYLVCDSADVRLSAVNCCADVLKPFINQYEKPDCPGREKVLVMIQAVLRSLVQVAVVDSEVAVRRTVLRCFAEADKIFHYHLAQAEMLDMVFMTLHDEKFEMQQEAVDLLGQLADLNPAFVYPRLRRVILEIISKLKNSKKAKLEEHSALLIQKIAVQCPKFVRPYMSSILEALVPHITGPQHHVGVQVRVLDALGELALVGGPDIILEMKQIFPSLIRFLQDTSNLRKREASLKTMGRLCQNSGYVVDPYKDYPDLLDILLKLLKNELSVSMRRQTVKILGIMGALDPYAHKVYTGMVHSAKTKSFALSLPIAGKSGEDRQDIMQWIAYEKCTLVQFYPSIAINKLLGLLEDEALVHYRPVIVDSLQKVFSELRSDCAPFVEQVIGKIIFLIQTCTLDKKAFYLQNLAAFVALVGKFIKPHLRDVFKLMEVSWRETDEPEIKKVVIIVLQRLGEALGTDFAPYVAELCPYLLIVVHSDESGQQYDLVLCALDCVQSIVRCLGPHIHLILPPVLTVVDKEGAEEYVRIRIKATETLVEMVRKLMLAEHAPMIMQTWMRCIGVKDLQRKLMTLLVALVEQMQRQFQVFYSSVMMLLDKYDIKDRQEFEGALKRINGVSANGYPNDENAFERRENRHSRTNYAAIVGKKPEKPLRGAQSKDITDLCATVTYLRPESTREDWNQFLEKVKVKFLIQSPSAALRSCASVAEVYSPLSSELFNAAFMAVWTNMIADDQDKVTRMLSYVLHNCKHPDPIQTILNLAEFMDHSEKGPFPVAPSVLSECARNTKAYAKALRYTELTVASNGKPDATACQAMIMYANKLNVEEISRGVVKIAEECNMSTSGRWYEKLGEWEKAMEMYKEEESATPTGLAAETAVCKMRCLESLGRWDQLRDSGKLLDDPNLISSHENLNARVAILAARGCWALGDWRKMEEYVKKVDVTHQDGSFLRAVLAIREARYTEATKYIQKVRDMFDSDLTTMASESYERAYGAMVLVQQLSELEEAIEYRIRPDRRSRIAVLWSRRLQGCRQSIEQWHRLLMVRSLVLSLNEMHPLWIKFASLCRRQGKTDLSRRVLRSLLNPASENATSECLDDNSPFELNSKMFSTKKPHLIFAVCKQMWIDGHHLDAYKHLKELKKFMEGTTRMQAQMQTAKDHEAMRESMKLVAKCYLKMGEWAPTCMSENVTTANGTPYVDVEKAEISFTNATRYDPKWQKAWQRLAITFYNDVMKDRKANGSLITEVKEFEQSTTRQIQSPIPVQSVQSPIPHVPMPLTVGLPQLTMSMPPIPNQTPIIHQMPATHPAHPGMMMTTGPIPQGMMIQGAMPQQPPPPMPPGLISQGQIPPQVAMTQPQGPIPGAMTQGVMPGVPIQAGPIPAPTMIIGGYPTTQVSTGGPVYVSPGYPPGFTPQQPQPLSQPSQCARSLVNQAMKTITYFAHAIRLAEGSRLENTLRLFQLVSDFGSVMEVNKHLTTVLDQIPVDTWLEVIPQLMAKLSSDPEVASLFKLIIVNLGKEHPQSLVYALTVASEWSEDIHKKAENPKDMITRAENAKAVTETLRETNGRLFGEAKMVADEFVRCAILWHEQWHDALEEASRLYFHEKNPNAMLDKLKPLHRMIAQTTTALTLKEQSFNTTYYNDLKDALEHCEAFNRTKDPKEMSQAWELYYNVFKRISQQLRQLNSLDLNYISPKLAEARDLELAVPGTYDPSKELVRISNIDPHLSVIMSKQRPRKINIRGSDGNLYTFLLKGHEDPRQDERVMQLFGLINTLLLHESDTCRRNLTIQRYSIVPLSQNSGLIGWVPNSDTLHALIRDYREKNKTPLSAEHKDMQKICSDIETLTLMQKVMVFKTAMSETPGDDLQKILWMKSPNSETWFDRRTNYTRSMACMSMVGYILGLGDRHPSNLMLDRLSGKIIHIDFGDCFEVAMQREKYPEKIPFRLTRMLVQAMEVTGIEGNYRITCERVLRVLRSNRESLLAVLEAFVYDPLITWRLDGNRNRTEFMNGSDGRLLNQKAELAISVINKKLTGLDFDPNVETPVAPQVQRLIFEARNEENLCQSYIGWCPFW